MNVAIIGGGTAGYLTALTLSKLLPGHPITVIESSKIPVIGVGESTTPKLLRLLHDVLKFDLPEFYREVQPTWKLGVRYRWGDPMQEFYNNALGTINPFLSLELKDDLQYNSLNSILMNKQKSFMVKTSDPEMPYRSLALPHSYAYHLDNERLVHYLKKKIKLEGISIIDTQIKTATQKENGDIDTLIGKEDEQYTFDFYVDCSGFASFLTGKSKKVPFVDYSSSLFTDRAITGNSKHNDIIKPYTEARTMNNGWQWNIPMFQDDHLGYVYSSAFCSDQQAEDEFRKLNPELRDTRLIRFRSGRHKDFISGNVAAIGNAYGFIEALQSTALHMVITNIYALVLHLKNLEKQQDFSKEINQNLGEIWDRLRWFIAMQFRLNNRSNTDFWRTCREEVNVEGVIELIQKFEKEGALYQLKENDRQLSETDKFQIYGLFSHDYMLLALGKRPGKMPFNLSEKDKLYANGKFALWDQLSEKALPQHEVIKQVIENPDVLNFNHFFENAFLLEREFDIFNKNKLAEFIIKC